MQWRFGVFIRRFSMAVVAAAAVAAAGAVAGGVISAQGAQAAAKAGKPRAQKFPLPPYELGLEKYQTRLLAENLTKTPPSFAQYVASGGTAQFPITDQGFTPQEARKLGIVGQRGQQVPFLAPGQTTLTPEQQLYVGYLSAQQGQKGGLARAFRENRTIGELLQKPQTEGRVERENKLRAMRNALLKTPPPTGGLK